ncbi:MAG: hypothetical protein H6974_09400 [Gammaproteobacteria bacterium]|nr:hypothetical protein [Gammaproteobacteria bacterium]
MSDATLARQEFAARLASIAPVRTGLAALETTRVDLPVFTLWNTDDRPAADQAYSAPAYTRSCTVEYKAQATATYDEDLDAVLRQVRLALKPPIGAPVLTAALALRETGVRFVHPDLAQSGSNPVAYFQITFEIDYLERLS